MTEEKSSRRTNPARTESRRQQVLDAAAACFCRHGFRGASMAEISACAGMSTGHIYHYFKNKEAIVEAIVERCQRHGLALIEEFKSADDILQTMIAQLSDAMARMAETTDPGLMLEIMAEASRNPVVAEIVRGTEATIRRSFEELLAAGQRQGTINPDYDVGPLCRLLFAVVDGLTLRRAVSPDLDADAVTTLHQELLRRFLTPIACFRTA